MSSTPLPVVGGAFRSASIQPAHIPSRLAGEETNAARTGPLWKSDYATPTIVGRYKEAPHSFRRGFADAASALTGDSDQSRGFMSLNGEWQIFWAEVPAQRPEGYFQPAFDDGAWGQIPVPANVEVHGHGTMLYTNIIYPWLAAEPPLIPEKYLSASYYRTRFTYAKPEEGRVFLNFDGVASAATIFLNGKYVGLTKDSRDLAEFDVTDLLQTGENLLALEVPRHCDASYLEDQDFWRFSGIFRDVYLTATPDVFIRDHFIETPLDSEYRDARLRVTARVQNRGKAPRAFTVAAKLLPIGATKADAAPIVEMTSQKVTLEAGEEATVRIETTVPAPRLWTAETPALYPLLLSTASAQKEEEIIEVIPTRVGFKQVEIRHGEVLVNGRAVFFKGVNRHEQDPEKGQYVDRASMVRDIVLMKQHNINAVRTSHYPDAPLWYDLCDEYGLYVVAESNIESHGMSYEKDLTLADKAEWQLAHLDRVQRNVEAQKNHVCVTFWSLGNESGMGANFTVAANWVKHRDPSRPVQYEGDVYLEVSQIWAPMYATVERLREVKINGFTDHPDRPRELPANGMPTILCEYCHTMGNSGGGLRDYWNFFYSSPGFQGGFTWEWVDHSMRRPAPVREILPDRSAQKVDGVWMTNAEAKGTGWVLLPVTEKHDISGPFTVEVWYRPNKLVGNAHDPARPRERWALELISPLLHKGESEWGLLQRANELIFRANTDGASRGSAVLIAPTPAAGWAEEWHHVAGVFTGEALEIWIDGKRHASKPYAGGVAQNAHPVRIGSGVENPGKRIHGLLRGARLYARALGEAELKDAARKAEDPSVRLWLDWADLRADGEFPAGQYWIYGGAFGPTDTASDHNFCCDGCVQADRTPTPTMAEFKKVYQYLEVTPVNLSTRVIAIRNRYDFLNPAETLRGAWQIVGDGVVVEEGELPALNIAPGTTMNFVLPAQQPGDFHPKPGVDYRLEIRFFLKHATAWAEAGFEVAWEQFELPGALPAAIVPWSEVGAMKSDFKPGQLSGVIAGPHFVARWEDGLLSGLQWQGKELLRGPLTPHFWRAGNDNDRGSRMPSRLAVWRNPGWSARALQVREVRAGVTEIRVEGILTGPDAAYRLTYLVYGSGDIVITARFQPGQRQLPNMPRFGLQVAVDGGLEEIAWYGRGPNETYQDRQEAAVGLYRGAVAGQYFDYSRPQETGNKTGVQWLALTDSRGQSGLLARGLPTLSANALRHTTEDLDNSTHRWLLPKRDFITLNLDDVQMGLAGDNSWGAEPLPAYRILPAAREYSLQLRPFTPSEIKAEVLARKAMPPIGS